MKEYRRHINKTDLAALIFMGLVFGIALAARLSGTGGTKPFAILTGAVFFALAWLILMPVRYELTAEELIIDGPWPLRRRLIRYEQILDLDSVGSFLPFKADADAVELVLTIRKDGTDRTKKVSCHPSHVKEFFVELKDRSPNLVKHETVRPIKDDVVQTLMETDPAGSQTKEEEKKL